MLDTIIRYLYKLRFRWVVSINGVLLLIAQISLFYFQQQPQSERIYHMQRILQSNNFSMFWYLIAGLFFFLFYRYKEKKSGYSGIYSGTFWIPLSIWVFGMFVTTALTIYSLWIWF